ncbi:MAG: hypothetical protein FWD90_00305 [Defluviitaleaceae bacterium]|nr:hypothetical protein [Defluviitaleaceae bacterium]
MSNLIKRVLILSILAAALLLPMTVRASTGAAVTSFRMDRTTVQAGQTITLTVHTNAEATHVFAEIGGSRTQGTQVSQNAAGIRTWNVTLTPAAGANRVDIYANTSNTVVGGVTLSIPITVEGTSTPQQPETPIAPLAIVSITEIQAAAAGQIRLEIVTGMGATDVWVAHSNPRRFHKAVRVRTEAATQVWQVAFNPTPLVQTVQVSANVGYYTGGTERDFQVQNSMPFVPQAQPLILSAVTNPAQLAVGSANIVTITTNNDVNYVWLMQGNTRLVNATRTSALTAPLRTWTATVIPATTGTITVHANSTNTATNAFTHNLPGTILATQATIARATVSWVTVGSEVRVEVETNQSARSVSVDIPNIGPRDLNVVQAPIGTGNVVWRLNFVIPANMQANWQANHANQAFIVYASDHTTLSIAGANATATVSGVGGNWWPGMQTTQGQYISLMTNPVHVNSAVPVLDTVEITTANDITGVRIRVGNNPWTTQEISTDGTVAGTLVWTIRNMWLQIPANATNVTLTVEVRRTTGGWISAPSRNIPVL